MKRNSMPYEYVGDEAGVVPHEPEERLVVFLYIE